MKKFLPLLLLCTCCLSSNVTKPETSKVVIVYNRQLLEDKAVILVNKTTLIQVIFSTGKSTGLKPSYYTMGAVTIQHSGKANRETEAVILEINTPYELTITVKSRSEGVILFIFEGKEVIGDKKLIHFKSI